MKNSRTIYPISVSVSMIVAAIVLSFVDLTFLNDVIGKLLDIGAIESMIVAFALGLVGIVIMAHQGLKEAYGDEKKLYAAGHYAIWISLGLAIVIIRLFSASILQLDTSSGDKSIITVMGMSIREIDLILAPLMFFLYLATGFMVKDGVKNLNLNPKFHSWIKDRQNAKHEKKLESEKISKAAEEKQKMLKDKAYKEQLERENEIKLRSAETKAMEDENRINNALNGTYSNALSQYRAKEKEIKDKYQNISANISYVRNIDKQEKDFETKVKPSLIKIIDGSKSSVQNSVALSVHKKTSEEITKLRSVIDSHNRTIHEKD